MTSKDFPVDTVVWAKMKGYPVWPAKISKQFVAKPPKNKKAHFVCFFGTQNFAWIQDKDITPHSESILNNEGKKKAPVFQKAVGELVLFLKNREKGKQLSKKETATISVKDENIDEKDIPKYEIVPKKEKEISEKTRNGEKNISTSSKMPIRKRPIETKVKEEPGACTSPKNQKLISENLLVGSTSDSVTDNATILEKDSVPLMDDDMGHFSIVQGKHFSPTKKRIGFIGIGQIGSTVVENLLKSGHNVTVWNKTPCKCEALVAIGARKANSPADLIVTCDITFCSVSGPDASKAIIFSSKGIVKGLEQATKLNNLSRGYVEMSSIDPETSRDIASVIAKKGGMYLEAPIYGNSGCAAEGTLLILASGDKELFLQCQSVFCSIGKKAYFLTSNVGYGSEMRLLLSTFSNTAYAAVLETLRLVERLGLEEEMFMTLLGLGPLQCQHLIEKCKRMKKSNFKTVTPLKHIQSHLDLTLTLGNQFSQRMPLTAAANEVYKHARRLRYGDLDVSAVYQGVRF